MSSPRTRVLAALLSATVLLAPVAACGGGDDGGAKSASKRSTPKADDTAAFVTRLTDAMATAKTAKLDLELGSSLSAKADVDYSGTGVSMAMQMITGAQTVKVVLVDGVMYLQQTKGSKYLKIDKSDPALGSLLGQLASFGPKSALESLKTGITKVADQGSETVDGTKVEHYVLTVDTKKVSSLFGVPEGTAKTPAIVSYDVWIDADSLLRQVKMTVSGQTLVMKASDWGKPVSIKVPPASQVMTR
ncbi:MAG: LppX_LprAFG lipoprotein [Marmoricola sp.]